MSRQPGLDVAIPGALKALFVLAALATCFASLSLRAASAPDRQGMQMRLAACAACHGKHGEGNMGRDGGIYPRLAGQPTDYLYHQMLYIKSERRAGIPPVTIMHRLLASLSPPYLHLIARYYHAASPPYPPLAHAAPTQLDEGRELVRQGLPGKDIAPCTDCHGADLDGRPPDVPALAGQYARYLKIQFAHWAQGARHNRLHEHIARTLTNQQVQAVARYLAALRPSDAAQAGTDRGNGTAGGGSTE